MELYYNIYITLFLFAIFELGSMKIKNIVLIFCCIFFTLFGGLRWNVGNDWYSYYKIFSQISWSNWYKLNRGDLTNETIEPLFGLINISLKTIFGTFYAYNLIIIAFIQFTYFKMCKHFAPSHPLLMYILLSILISNYFPVRAGLSLAIVFWAYLQLERKQMKKYIVVVILASLIHVQCLIMLPFYWLNTIKIKYFSGTILFLSITIGAVIIQNAFGDLFILLKSSNSFGRVYEYSRENDSSMSLNLFRPILYYLFFVVFIYFRKFEINKPFYNGLIVMYLAFYSIGQVFGEGMGDLARLSGVFAYAYIILLLKFFCGGMLSKRPYIRLFSVIFFLVFIPYRITKIADDPYFKDTCVPYKTIFDYNV